MEAPDAFHSFLGHTSGSASTCLITYEYNCAVYRPTLPICQSFWECMPTAWSTSSKGRSLRLPNDSSIAITKTIYDWRRYLFVAQRKPIVLCDGAPFHELPDSFRKLRLHARFLPRPGGDCEMVDILALLLLYNESLV